MTTVRTVNRSAARSTRAKWASVLALAGVMALTGVALLATSPGQSVGQQEPLEIKAEDTVRSVLERSVGRRVEVALVSGEKLVGTVRLVNGDLVHLAELQGREFFDAVARIDRIDAIVYRTRTR